jgi:hypothetical protein
MGNVPDLFDGDKNTLIRGLEDNPFVLEFVFDPPRRMSQLYVRVGEMEGQIALAVTTAAGGEPLTQTRTVRRGLDYTEQTFTLGAAPLEVTKIHMEIGEPGRGEPDHIEVREVTFR